MVTISQLKKIKAREEKKLKLVKEKEKLIKEINQIKMQTHQKAEQKEEGTSSGLKKVGKKFIDYLYGLSEY